MVYSNWKNQQKYGFFVFFLFFQQNIHLNLVNKPKKHTTKQTEEPCGKYCRSMKQKGRFCLGWRVSINRVARVSWRTRMWIVISELTLAWGKSVKCLHCCPISIWTEWKERFTKRSMGEELTWVTEIGKNGFSVNWFLRTKERWWLNQLNSSSAW